MYFQIDFLKKVWISVKFRVVLQNGDFRKIKFGLKGQEIIESYITEK